MKRNGVTVMNPILTFAGAIGQFPIWMTFFFTIQVAPPRQGCTSSVPESSAHQAHHERRHRQK